MLRKNVADLLVDVLAQAGVHRIYGVSGDSLNAVTESLRVTKQLEWVHVRHEETAAFAAGAEAHLTGGLAVCAGSCGPGNLHLINGLYECQRSRVPVLAIAAQGVHDGGAQPAGELDQLRVRAGASGPAENRDPLRCIQHVGQNLQFLV